MKLISKKTILFMSVLAIAGIGYYFHNKKAEAQLVMAQAAQVESLVRLYKALGVY